MKKPYDGKWEQIRLVSDDEIRSFIVSEKDRLGNILQGFEVTWNPTETGYQLELYSCADGKEYIGKHPWPFGSGFCIGELLFRFGEGVDILDEIQEAGREFYYLWRKEIKNLKRNLGRRAK